MSTSHLTLISALMLSTAPLAFTPVLAAECTLNCIPATPDMCAKDTVRPCGPLRDSSAVEQIDTQNNIETQAVSVTDNAFRISVDGVAVDGSAPGKADVKRQEDVKAAQAKTIIQADTMRTVPMLSAVANVPAAAPGDVVKFFTHTNYARNIDMAEILLYSEGGSREATPYLRLPVRLGEPVLWTPGLQDQGNFRFVLRVYGKNGRWDETLVQSLRISRAKDGQADGKADNDERSGAVFENMRVVSNINVRGATVTVSGKDLPKGARVELFGMSVPIDSSGKFVAETIVPEGTTKVGYTIKLLDGTTQKVERDVEIKRQDTFLVAIADVTGGHRSWNNEASVAALQGEQTDTRNNYIDGRLAFYYKGKLNETYRVTASADTGEHPLKDLFDQFGDKDSRSFLRRLDPDRHYPVYGDDSTTVEDAPTYGRFYARIEDDRSELMWGNFQTDLNGNELTQFSRSLYGGNLGWHSRSATSDGEKRTNINIFAADPGTIGSREEFRSTGTSLYYLRRQDVTQGTERVSVEIRDRSSGLVLERRELAAARDYDVNYLQGRLLLRSPVPINAEVGEFVRDGALSGNPVFVVVTYEYSPGLTQPSTFTLGGRGTQWLGDHIRLGATGYHQGEDQANQQLYGGDILLRYKPGTYIKGEYAKSDGTGNGSNLSATGGYDFNDVQAAGGKANAYTLEGAVSLSDLGIGNGRVAAYWRNRGAGFSGPGALTGGQSVEQVGASTDIMLGKRTTFVGKADFSNSLTNDSHILQAGVAHEFENGWFGKVGVKADDRTGGASILAQSLAESGNRFDGGVTVGYRSDGHVVQRGTATALFGSGSERASEVRDIVAGGTSDKRTRPWSVYAFGQSTLSKDAGRNDNNRYGLGGDIQLDQRTRINAELSDGDRGTGADIGADYAYSDRGSLHLGYALAAENPDGFNTGRLGRLSATTKHRFTDAVSVFAEGRYDHGSGPSGLTQAYGVDFSPTKSWRFGLRYETGALADAYSGDIKRHAFGGNVDYTNAAWRWSSALEYRSDSGTVVGERSTWATRSTLTIKANDDMRLYGKFNFAFSNGNGEESLKANYYEVVAATAYRPVHNDRLNLLGKYTYLYDLASPNQLSPSGNSSRANGTVDFAQRSHVFAVDATYQLNRWLAVGGKYAFRTGEIRSSRDQSAAWQSSTAHFWAVRADVNIIKEWDALAEVRRLSVNEAQDARFGALVGVYRHLGKHMKIGIGYNFTDFSDDLTDLSYNENGVFFNIIAKF
jgi:hypothetical protein